MTNHLKIPSEVSLSGTACPRPLEAVDGVASIQHILAPVVKHCFSL